MRLASWPDGYLYPIFSTSSKRKYARAWRAPVALVGPDRGPDSRRLTGWKTPYSYVNGVTTTILSGHERRVLSPRCLLPADAGAGTAMGWQRRHADSLSVLEFRGEINDDALGLYREDSEMRRWREGSWKGEKFWCGVVDRKKVEFKGGSEKFENAEPIRAPIPI